MARLSHNLTEQLIELIPKTFGFECFLLEITGVKNGY